MEKIHLSEASISKLVLCNVFRMPIQDVRFSFQDFYNNVIKAHSNNVALSHYAIILYYYGIHCRQFYDSMNTPEMQANYAEHDNMFTQIVELKTQLISILKDIERNEPPQIYLTNSQGKNRELVFSTNYSQNDVRELIVKHLKETLSFIYNEHCKGSERIEESDITIEFLENWIRVSDEEHTKEGVNRMGRPLSLEMLMSHRCIQDLSLILRIDALLDNKEIYANLVNISLSAEDHRSIFGFLDFFGLLFYDDNSFKTTQPNDVIKDRFKYFYKSNSLSAHRKDVEERIRTINIYCSRIKRTLQNQKG